MSAVELIVGYIERHPVWVLLDLIVMTGTLKGFASVLMFKSVRR